MSIQRLAWIWENSIISLLNKFLDESNIDLFENQFNINPYQSIDNSAVKIYTQGIAYV